MADNITPSQQAQRRASQINGLNARVKAFKDYLLKYEGFDPVARKGSGEKFYTIGHGHYGADVKPGQRITRPQAAALLDRDVRRRIPELEKLLPDFASFPMSAQEAIFGEFYRGSIGGSPKTRGFINERNYGEAAKEFLRNKEYINRVALNRAGIGPRMENVSKELMKMAKAK
jgi:GH24 family phage-related lysozyme (muramidase)